MNNMCMGCEFGNTASHGRQYSFAGSPASMQSRDSYSESPRNSESRKSQGKNYN